MPQSRQPLPRHPPPLPTDRNDLRRIHRVPIHRQPAPGQPDRGLNTANLDSYHRGMSGSRWPASPSTSYARPEPPRRSGTPRPDGPPCGPTWSPSRPGSHPQPAASSCTCRRTGPGPRPGRTSGPPPPPDRHRPTEGPEETPHVEEPDRPANASNPHTTRRTNTDRNPEEPPPKSPSVYQG